MKIRIKYFEGATTPTELVCIFPQVLNVELLGFALELPQGWEGHLAPRSSTFKTWGIIQTNSVGVVDDTYIGDNDQWHMPVYCLQAKHDNGTWIRTGDKIGQFRIMEVMPEIQFDEVESFGNCDRGGFGTTGIN